MPSAQSVGAHQRQSAKQLLEPIHLMSDAISAIIRRGGHATGNPSSIMCQSVVIRGHQWSSEVIRDNPSSIRCQSVVIRGHQWSSEVIRGNPSSIRCQSEEAIRAQVTLTKPFDGRPPPRPSAATAATAPGALAGALAPSARPSSGASIHNPGVVDFVGFIIVARPSSGASIHNPASFRRKSLPKSAPIVYVT